MCRLEKLASVGKCHGFRAGFVAISAIEHMKTCSGNIRSGSGNIHPRWRSSLQISSLKRGSETTLQPLVVLVVAYHRAPFVM